MNFPIFGITSLPITCRWARSSPMRRLVLLLLKKEAIDGGLISPEVTPRVHTRLQIQSL